MDLPLVWRADARPEREVFIFRIGYEGKKLRVNCYCTMKFVAALADIAAASAS